MSLNAKYAAFPRFARCTIQTANTAFDGTGAIQLFFTAHPTFGSRIDTIQFQARAATTAGFIKWFVRENSGQAWSLCYVDAVPARTPTVGVDGGFQRGVGPLNWILAPNMQVGFATHNAETFDITLTNGGDFLA